MEAAMIKNSELLVILLMIPVFFQIVLPLFMLVVFAVTKAVKSVFFKTEPVQDTAMQSSTPKELQADMA